MSDNHASLRPQIVAIICTVFGLSPESVAAGVSPDRVENWNSEKHVELVLALEERFACMFDAEEVPELTTLERMEEIIRRHG
jgi:acyl carrier protein